MAPMTRHAFALVVLTTAGGVIAALISSSRGPDSEDRGNSAEQPSDRTEEGPAKQPRTDRAATPLTWRLNNPAPAVIAEAKANPGAVADKFASRMRSIAERRMLRAYEGAPPVVPHSISDLSVQACRECHATGLRAGDKVARMVSHSYLTNCTQCHVEAQVPGDSEAGSEFSNGSSFVGLSAAGYGGTRAWAGAPPLMPHSSFMRTNCTSCHGEHGYDGWRPDHLSRTNCIQCHAPAAEFDQLAPSFGMADRPDPDPPASRK